MEVAIGSNGSRPFQREVREWQRIDPNTGALLTGRLEADRWINGPQNAYGKVVDSQNLSQPNGTQHTQRKQLEVLQARTSSGSLQVVRAQTVQTSSSRWSSSSSSTSTPKKQALQSIDGPPRFSIPLQQLTNGHHSMTNGHEDHFNHHSHQFMTEPSLKLSSLMKNTVVSNNSQRSSPHSPTINSAQRHRNDVIQLFAADRGGRSASDTDGESYSPERVCSERGILDAGHSNNLRRSVSNDDLTSIDWNKTDHESGGDSSEWRRVSKIRRSFQLPKSTSPKPNAARPLDLPENSVSVSRIRHELENGRRVSASMRSDHVDLMALDTILNGSSETAENKSTQKTPFITAESLKEIRGKLKKLSDESLYKEDFITQNDIDRGKTYAANSVPIRKEYATQKPVVLEDSEAVQELPEKPDSTHNTNSWENRIRHRDMNSTEWYSRRKSYGFEKMVPPSASMFRQESSTDSGIGRSGEQVNWSPTESTPRGTVITFGDPTKTSITLMNSSPSHSNNYQNSYESNDQVVEVKRHSIAVDESKYVRENTRIATDSKTAVHVNGYYTRELDSTQTSVFDENGKRQKRRVEFCKTEVHFAAESGRVNIVETDGKPPPTNNFRRRRRGIGGNGGGPIGNAYLEAITSGKPVIHFGDDFKDQYDPNALTEENMNVTVITNGHGGDSGSGSSVLYEEEAESDEISIRSILKNKPVKPRPYHLGENIESSESLWGVRLRPVSSEAGVAPTVGDVQEVKREATYTSSNKSSVAERVRIVEERKDDSGYSTKINLKISNSPYSWETPDQRPQIEINPPTSVKLRSSDRRRSTHFENLNDTLKSTSLIMKTIRSQSCYEDSSFPLPKLLDTQNYHNNVVISSKPIEAYPSKKPTSTGSVSSETIKSTESKHFAREYRDDESELESSSRSSKIISSSSFSSTSSSSFQYERGSMDPPHILHLVTNNSRPEDDLRIHRAKPIAAPRMKVIGSTNAVSHQLSQLRRMYDAADGQSDDSMKADEEVKLYLDYAANTVSIDDRVTELSGSWSRIKAKKASVRQTKINDLKELPKSNVMKIELHSPAGTLERKGREDPAPIPKDVPVAKPRKTINSVKTMEQAESPSKDIIHEKPSEVLKVPGSGKLKRPDSLKIESGGARKLKVHELLYFGVKSPNEEIPMKMDSSSTSTKTLKETKQKRHSTSEIPNKNWQLSSDKPDLLLHSPVKLEVIPSASLEAKIEKNHVEIKKDPIETVKQGPVYENLQKPSTYSRKRDAERDEMILKEMHKEAEQALQAIGSGKSSKDHHRRSSHRRSKEQLETIDEKRTTKPSQVNSSVRPSSDGHYRQCCSNRSSSISSTESLSRPTGSSRSKSTKATTEQPSKRSSQSSKDSSSSRTHRSSPRDSSQRKTTPHNSSEELHNGNHHQRSNGHIEAPHRPRRGKSREKERIVVKVDENQRITRSTVKTEDRKASSIDSTKGSQRSSKGEKIDRNGSTRSKVSSTRSSSDSRKMTRSSTIKPSTSSGAGAGAGAGVTATYVYQPLQTIVPPPRKKRRNQLNRNIINTNIQHTCSNSFTYLPSAKYVVSPPARRQRQRRREMRSNSMNRKYSYQKRRKSMGLCICS